MENIVDSILIYKSYGLENNFIFEKMGISKSNFYKIKKKINESLFVPFKKNNNNHNTITEDEKNAVLKYALDNPKYFHRELTYRLIDENIAFLSESSVYRLLKENNLIKKYKKKKNYGWKHRYSNEAGKPDELWQTDLTYIKYKNNDLYQLSFIDVFSRYIVLSITLTDMSSNTVSRVFNEYLKKNMNNLKRKPRLQSDNGSSYIGGKNKKLISNN